MLAYIMGYVEKRWMKKWIGVALVGALLCTLPDSYFDGVLFFILGISIVIICALLVIGDKK